jgi:phosphoglycolate phosphatase
MLVAFDLDGTLVDSSGDLSSAGNALIEGYGARPLPPPAVIAMVGDGARELVRRLLAASALEVPLDEALARFLALYDERLLATTVPYAGIPELLRGLHRHARLSVLTNKPVEPSERILRALGLRNYFDDVIGGDSDFGRKPTPDGLVALIDRAGVTKSRALMVGDSITDLRTARNARVAACLVRYGFGFAQVSEEESAEAAFLVDRPAEIAAAVARLTAS